MLLAHLLVYSPLISSIHEAVGEKIKNAISLNDSLYPWASGNQLRKVKCIIMASAQCTAWSKTNNRPLESLVQNFKNYTAVFPEQVKSNASKTYIIHPICILRGMQERDR